MIAQQMAATIKIQETEHRCVKGIKKCTIPENLLKLFTEQIFWKKQHSPKTQHQWKQKQNPLQKWPMPN